MYRIHRTKMMALLLSLMLGGGVYSAAQAEVYQCTAQGKITFSDKPCKSSSQAEDITSRVATRSETSFESIREGKSVCRPQFEYNQQPFSAGTAFILDRPVKNAKAVLITAHHLFGKAGGLDTEIQWQDLADNISKVECTFIGSGVETINLGAPFIIPNAHSFVGGGIDIAAFPIPSVPPYALKLANTTPAQGDPVFLIAPLVGDKTPGNFVHHASVVLISKNLLRFEYADPAFKLQATSGAPVVNAQGQVVGVNVGGTERDGKYYGIAINLDTLIQALGSIRY
jgi:hypothetical protein